MRFSVWPGAAQPSRDLVALARQADAGFWHCVYVFDHFMPSGYLSEDETGMLEATGALAALAGSTSRVRDEGVDEVIIPDRAMSVDQRGDAYDALADALGELS